MSDIEPLKPEIKPYVLEVFGNTVVELTPEQTAFLQEVLTSYVILSPSLVVVLIELVARVTAREGDIDGLDIAHSLTDTISGPATVAMALSLAISHLISTVRLLKTGEPHADKTQDQLFQTLAATLLGSLATVTAVQHSVDVMNSTNALPTSEVIVAAAWSSAAIVLLSRFLYDAALYNRVIFTEAQLAGINRDNFVEELIKMYAGRGEDLPLQVLLTGLSSVAGAAAWAGLYALLAQELPGAANSLGEISVVSMAFFVLLERFWQEQVAPFVGTQQE